jgi:hypothetical protein
MLAYVFWHWRTQNIAQTAYQSQLIAFHEILQQHKPAGFERSFIFQHQHVPWLTTDTEVYEDWYLVENFTALEALNQGAVSGPRTTTHNTVAQHAAGGIAGIYKLIAGTIDPHTIHTAHWFSKPAELTYTQQHTQIQTAITRLGGYCWQRQMTLGPTPEFCWHNPTQPPQPCWQDCQDIPLQVLRVGH